jgi:hypothetical protein
MPCAIMTSRHKTPNSSIIHMKTDDHKNDIWIGGERWITYIDIQGRTNQAVNIDSLLTDTAMLWDSLETFCMADCCGLDAFDFSPEHLQTVTATNVSVSARRVDNLIASIHALPQDILSSHRLNMYIHKQPFLELLQHLRDFLEPTAI